MSKIITLTATLAFSVGSALFAGSEQKQNVSADLIEKQRAALASATDGKGFGPQSPRDIDLTMGDNTRVFAVAPEVTEMTLCDIHLHTNAEHKGGEFTTFAGYGDGKGFGTGYKYSGALTASEATPIAEKIGDGPHGALTTGDTIEIHFVHSTAQATLGNGLGTCLSDAIGNPQLRVEAVVAVLVSDGGEDFTKMAQIETDQGVNQVPNLPTVLGTPVVYNGSTTGPGYNEKGSPFQVTWSVRPGVAKLDINSVGAWLKNNPFDEKHAHGVRNLVENQSLLSPIK